MVNSPHHGLVHKIACQQCEAAITIEEPGKGAQSEVILPCNMQSGEMPTVGPTPRVLRSAAELAPAKSSAVGGTPKLHLFWERHSARLRSKPASGLHEALCHAIRIVPGSRYPKLP